METWSHDVDFADTDTVEASPSLEDVDATGEEHAVAALLRQLAIAARLLPLYDARNDTLRHALAMLLEHVEAVLSREARLELVIAPFEILWRERPVYHDADRERSLAFCLYRDGVRLLVFHRGLDAEELARFLHVVAAGHDGVPRAEDDTVTMLWEARLRSIEFVAVDGLRPDEDSEDQLGTAQSGGMTRPRSFLPEDVDLPLPAEDGRRQPEWLELPSAALEALRLEDRASRAEDGVQLLTGLEAALADPELLMRFDELRRLCEELREALLTVETLPLLLRFVHSLRRIAREEAAWDPERHAQVVELILSCGSDEAVQRLIHTTPPEDTSPRPELLELLSLVCPDPISAATGALAALDSPAARAVARQLVEHYGRRYGAQLRQRFGAWRGRPAADLLRLLTRLDGETTPDFLARQCGHPDPEVREEACWHLERTAFTSSIGHGLAAALRVTDGEHRRRLLRLIERSHDRRFVVSLLNLLDTEMPIEEAAEIAALVGRLEGGAGLSRWRRWLTPGGRFFRRHLPGEARQQILAAAAVASVPGAESSHLLRQALTAAAAEVHAWIELQLETRGEPLQMGRAS